MDNIFLSNESYETLQKLASSSNISNNIFSDSCIDQLLEYGLIESHVIDYELTSNVINPVFSDYSVTEKGIGYLTMRQTQEENINMFKSMVASAEKQADASKKQADLAQAADHAEAEAKIARRDALFSKILAILAIIVSLASPFLSAYATSIVNMLSQMLK